MRWDRSTKLAAELGESGPWVWYLKDAWHACASDAPEAHLHQRPSVGTNDWRAKAIAFWTPMFHPLVFGLGWTRPDLGLARWRDVGFAPLDPVLVAALRWWRKDGIESLLAWAAITDVFIKQSAELTRLAGVTAAPREHLPDTREWTARRAEPDWQETWGGGGDPFHLWHHAILPLGGPVAPPDRGQHLGVPASAPKHHVNPASPSEQVLLLDTYPRWYEYLLAEVADSSASEVAIDVVCKPVGWLGTYRISPATGLWHRGDEFVHMLGN